MAKTFTKIGKEITIAVKQGGPDVVGNSRLRALMAEARSENMPKDNVEKAIKRALEKNQGDFKEVVFEGYGPHGIAYPVETATDNNTRTVANVRSYFTKCGGSLGTSGSVSFMFDHKCVFRIKYQEEWTSTNFSLPFATAMMIQRFSSRSRRTRTRTSRRTW